MKKDILFVEDKDGFIHARTENLFENAIPKSYVTYDDRDKVTKKDTKDAPKRDTISDKRLDEIIKNYHSKSKFNVTTDDTDKDIDKVSDKDIDSGIGSDIVNDIEMPSEDIQTGSENGIQMPTQMPLQVDTQVDTPVDTKTNKDTKKVTKYAPPRDITQVTNKVTEYHNKKTQQLTKQIQKEQDTIQYLQTQPLNKETKEQIQRKQYKIRVMQKRLKIEQETQKDLQGFDDKLFDNIKTTDILMTDTAYTPPSCIPDDNNFRRDILDNMKDIVYDPKVEREKYSYQKVVESRRKKRGGGINQ